MFQSRFKLVLLALLLSLSGASHALSVVTWNLEHLMDQRQFEVWRGVCTQAAWDDGASNKFRREPLPPCGAHSGVTPWGDKQSKALRTWADYSAKLAILKARALELNADVYLLQEVGSSAAVALVIDPARYTISSTEGSAKTPLHLAVAVRKGVTVAQAPMAFMGIAKHVTYNGEQRQLRPGLQLALTVNGKRIELLNVHLKSGCRNDAIDQPDVRRKDVKATDRKRQDCAQLRLQIPEIEAWIERRQASNTAFIVAGDFNRSLWRERAEAKPARCDATDAAKPLGNACLANPLAEWDDDPARKLLLTKTQVKAFANGASCAVKQPRADGEALCHCGIDHLLVNEALLQALGVKIGALTATGDHYGVQHYGLDKPRASDHCPIKLNL